jgi:hypothetical protein
MKGILITGFLVFAAITTAAALTSKVVSGAIETRPASSHA